MQGLDSFTDYKADATYLSDETGCFNVGNGLYTMFGTANAYWYNGDDQTVNGYVSGYPL
jgi:hypothetical protein